MKFRVVSDLHLEFEDFNLPKMVGDKQSTLVLAGDIAPGHYKDMAPNFLEKMVKRFAHVVYVPGNHEFYKGNLDYTWDSMKAKVVDKLRDQGFDAYLHMLNNQTVVIENTAFICSTLWTNYDHHLGPTKHVESMINAQECMNDFKLIRKGENYSKTTAYDYILRFNDSKKFIFDEVIKAQDKDLNTVVVTHHGPSMRSVSEDFRHSNVNGAYASQLDDMIMYAGPNYWFHGHTHVSMDYTIHNTRVMTNPKGYRKENFRRFDPLLRFEL